MNESELSELMKWAAQFDIVQFWLDTDADVSKEVSFSKDLDEEIITKLKSELFNQKLKVKNKEKARYWDNEKVYETQLKLCADNEIMPKIWRLALEKGKIKNIINGLAETAHHYKNESLLSTTKEMQQDAEELTQCLRKIESIFKRNTMLKSSTSCDLRDFFKSNAHSVIAKKSNSIFDKLCFLPPPLDVALKNGDSDKILTAISCAVIERVSEIPPNSLEMIAFFQEKLRLYQGDNYADINSKLDRYVKRHFRASQGTRTEKSPHENMVARRVCELLRPLYSKNAVTDFLKVLRVLDDCYCNWSESRLTKLLANGKRKTKNKNQVKP